MGRLRTGMLTALAFVAGLAVSFFTLPLWVTVLINWAREGSRTDWLGFAGGLLGSLLTGVIAAAAIVVTSRGVKQQLNVALVSREEDRIEDELPKLREAQIFAIYCWQVFRDHEETIANGVLSQKSLDIETAISKKFAVSRLLMDHSVARDLEMTIGLVVAQAIAFQNAMYRFRQTSETSPFLSAHLSDYRETQKQAHAAAEVHLVDATKLFRDSRASIDKLVKQWTDRIIELERRRSLYRTAIESYLHGS